MSNTTVIVMMCAAGVESLIIIFGNIFTIFVFWKYRNRLKRTSFLLINLAVADLLVGFTEIISLGTTHLPRHLEEPSILRIGDNISVAFQTTFSFSSVFFLVLISLERAYALIWPLRHRVASKNGYICSVTFAWVAGLSLGALTTLAVYDILDLVKWVIILGCTMVLCLITVCVSYLAIRTRLNRRVPAIDAAHSRQNWSSQNAKFSRTLFVVISVSFLCWLPNILVNCTQSLCSGCVPLLVYYIFNVFRLTNSLLNPIIYSFRIPMFRETFKRMKLCKQSKQYIVNYVPGHFR